MSSKLVVAKLYKRLCTVKLAFSKMYKAGLQLVVYSWLFTVDLVVNDLYSRLCTVKLVSTKLYRRLFTVKLVATNLRMETLSTVRFGLLSLQMRQNRSEQINEKLPPINIACFLF